MLQVCGHGSAMGVVKIIKQTFQDYILPIGPIKVGRQWGQRGPHGANLGSNGILKLPVQRISH